MGTYLQPRKRTLTKRSTRVTRDTLPAAPKGMLLWNTTRIDQALQSGRDTGTHLEHTEECVWFGPVTDDPVAYVNRCDAIRAAIASDDGVRVLRRDYSSGPLYSSWARDASEIPDWQVCSCDAFRTPVGSNTGKLRKHTFNGTDTTAPVSAHAALTREPDARAVNPRHRNHAGRVARLQASHPGWSTAECERIVTLRDTRRAR